MKLLPSALLALLLAYSPMAFCENWVCSERQNESLCIDLDSIKDEGAYRTARTKTIPFKESIVEGVLAYEIKALASLDCGKKTLAMLSATLYGKDKEVLKELSNKHPNYRPFAPTSVGEFFYNHSCGKK